MTGAAFFDLDRTLLRVASGPTISAALRAEGVLGGSSLPGEKLLFGLFNAVGETLPSMLLTRQGVRAAKGWDVDAVRRAGERAAPELLAQVQPYAMELIDEHRAAGRPVLVATTTPYDVLAPFAELAGFDGLLATRYRIGADHRYDGTIDGEFVWNRGKARSVENWAVANGVSLADSFAYSDSIFDTPLFSLVGHPTAVNPDPRLAAYAAIRRWPIVWFDAPPGVPKPLGVEPQQVVQQIARDELWPWLRFDVDGVDRLDTGSEAIVASNHRSYLDPLVVGYTAAKAGRPARFLAKKEVTDAPVVGQIATAMGAIRVDRGGDTDASMQQAERALRAGELVAVFPQGTIPRGPAFFEPELRGRYGAIRLARATGAPIVPLGLWGSELAWPRDRKLPYMLNLADPPTLWVRVGEPYHPDADLDLDDAVADLMERIVALCPPEARERRTPTEAELARTYPDGVIPTA